MGFSSDTGTNEPAASRLPGDGYEGEGAGQDGDGEVEVEAAEPAPNLSEGEVPPADGPPPNMPRESLSSDDDSAEELLSDRTRPTRPTNECNLLARWATGK